MASSTELLALQRAPSAGWEAQKDEIHQMLKQCPENKVTTIYIEGASGSGKSTRLFSDIVNNAMKEYFGSKGILIVRTEDEAQLMKNVLHLDDDPLAKVQPPIWSRDLFLDQRTVAERIESLGGSIVFCDVEVLSSTEDEIFWGYLIETAMAIKQSTTWMGLVLCASHRSDRTIDAIREKLDPKLKIISCCSNDDDDDGNGSGKNDNSVEWEQVQPKDWAFRLDWDLLEKDDEALVVILGGGQSQLSDLKLAMDKRYIHRIDGNSAVPDAYEVQECARVLWVGEDIEWALTLPKVECVFLDDCKEDVLMDQSVGLLVRVTRKLAKTELVRRQSWLRRALWWSRDYQNREGVTEVTPFPLTKVMSVCSQEDIKQRPDEYSKFDPAWNAGVMLTVLAHLDSWPGLHPDQMPCRKPPSMALWTETCQLLRIAGAITEDMKPTNLGTLVAIIESVHHWGFAETYMVATLRVMHDSEVGSRYKPQQWVYILMLMAAIIRVEAEYKRPLVTLQGSPDDWTSNFGDSCAGGAAGMCSRGSLWLQVGVYRKKHDAKGKFAHEHIKVSHRSYKRANELMEDISRVSGFDHVEQDREREVDPDGTLGRPGQNLINRVLAKAFAGQMLFVKGQDLEAKTANCVHVASGATVEAPMESDMLYVGDKLRHWKAMYMFSTRPMEPDGTRLRATGLTQMDRVVLEDIAKDVSHTWPDVVKRPLWPMTYYKYRGGGGSGV